MFLRILVLLSVFFIGVSKSESAVITIDKIESQAVTLSGLAPGTVFFDEFDPALGQLKRVDIFFDYAVSLDVFAAPNLVGPYAVPQPYLATAVFGMSIDGLGGRGFDSFTDSFLTTMLPANGLGGPVSTAAAVSYAFSFSESILPITYETVQPAASGTTTPFVFAGSLAGFQPENPNVTGVPIFLRMGVSPLMLDPRLTFLMAGFSGKMEVNYHYQQEVILPDPDDEDGGDTAGPDVPDLPSVVPVPAGLPLMLGGLGLFVGLGRLRKRQAA